MPLSSLLTIPFGEVAISDVRRLHRRNRMARDLWNHSQSEASFWPRIRRKPSCIPLRRRGTPTGNSIESYSDQILLNQKRLPSVREINDSSSRLMKRRYPLPAAPRSSGQQHLSGLRRQLSMLDDNITPKKPLKGSIPHFKCEGWINTKHSIFLQKIGLFPLAILSIQTTLRLKDLRPNS